MSIAGAGRAAGSSPWPRAVVLDLDGTLIDSAPDIAAALNTALVESGHQALDVAVVTGMIGAGARTLIERALAASGVAASAGDVDAVYGSFLNAYAREPVRLTRLYPGARDALEGFSGRGVRLAICTNKPLSLTGPILERLGLAEFFHAVIAADGSLPLKPAPDMLLRALAGLDTPPTQAVMVGDSAADAGCAEAAGVACVLIGHGYNHGSPAGLGAAALIDCFAELDTALDRLAPSRGA